MFGGFGNQSNNGAAIERLALAVVVFLTMLVSLASATTAVGKGGLVFFKPEIVDWSPNVPGHWGNQIKQICHIGIILTISCPSFDPDETWISFGVSNLGRKALGIGPGGIVLVPVLSGQIMWCKTMRTRSLSGDEVEVSSLMVDTERSNPSIYAFFEPASKPDRVMVVIQMKRILSANLEFRIPFDLGGS